jgi:hypothetical protein
MVRWLWLKRTNSKPRQTSSRFSACRGSICRASPNGIASISRSASYGGVKPTMIAVRRHRSSWRGCRSSWPTPSVKSRERAAYAAEARELLRRACEQCLPDLNEEQTRAFDAQMQAALEADPPIFASKEERASLEQRYAVANPRWNRIPEARRRYLEELSTTKEPLAKLHPRQRELVEGTLRNYPGLTAEGAIEVLKEFGGF